MSTTKNTKNIEASYKLARERYAALGVDTDQALQTPGRSADLPPLLAGRRRGRLRERRRELGGGLAVTGNYPGKARTAARTARRLREGAVAHPRQPPLQSPRLLRRDERQQGGPRRVRAATISRTGSPGPSPSASAWISTRPSSPIPRRPAASRCRSADKAIRKFWIEHGIRRREIGAAIGKALGKTCVTNSGFPTA